MFLSDLLESEFMGVGVDFYIVAFGAINNIVQRLPKSVLASVFYSGSHIFVCDFMLLELKVQIGRKL